MNLIAALLFLLTNQSAIEPIHWHENQITIHYNTALDTTQLRETGIENNLANNAGIFIQNLPATKMGEVKINSKARETKGFFLADKLGNRITPTIFPTLWDPKSDPDAGLPTNRGIKGLQVQMMDDAITLGVNHAAFNLNIATLIRIPPKPEDTVFEADGITVGIRQDVIDSLPMKLCQEKGIRTYLIILAYRTGNPAIDNLLLHPNMPLKTPHNLGAFNTKTPAGIKAFQSIMDQLCKSFSRPSEKKGAVAGWIIGNEVNAHHEWYNCGSSDPDEVVAEYHKALRIAHASLKRANAPGRIYASFEHHWAMQPGPNPKQSIPGKTFLQGLINLSKTHGDFDWHLAYHPYPENLFEPRSWLDKSALPNLDTPKITFMNLEQLSAWVNIPNNLYQGTPRRIILSEQGFHGKPGSPGEQNQAAGYVYGYRKALASKSIDAFILHRHVDHAKEGGLMLGLHSNAPGSIATPLAKKEIWQVFHDAGTPQELQSFEKYKKILGDNAWNEIYPNPQPK